MHIFFTIVSNHDKNLCAPRGRAWFYNSFFYVVFYCFSNKRFVAKEDLRYFVIIGLQSLAKFSQSWDNIRLNTF